jgi:glycolate oxidase FAD binding subunit
MSTPADSGTRATWLYPADVDDLRQSLADATGRREPVAAVDLSALAAVVDFSPEDMTVTTQTGITLGALQARLALAGQWLPVDPPVERQATVADVLHHDLSGPRRFGYGTIREHVIGLAAVLVDGRLVRSGGRVVKNVAGYDLARLLVGSRGTLGLIVEATFKLRPLPATEVFLEYRSTSLDAIEARLEETLAGPTDPVILDLVTHDEAWVLIVGFAGYPADVAWQVAHLPGTWEPREAPDHDAAFLAGRTRADVTRTAVLPSRLIAYLRGLPPGPVLAHAGNGIVYTCGVPATPVGSPVGSPVGPPAGSPAGSREGSPVGPAPGPTDALTQRVRAAFDPHGILSRLQ